MSLLLGAGLFAQEAPSFTAEAAVLMDYETGRILFDKNSDRRIPPASMTKVMTLLLCYDALASGELSRDQMITIDEAGSSFSRPPFSSLMLLEEGQVVSVLDLMKGLAVSSGNDAAYALAELIGPGETAFVEKMNAKAEELGLKVTRFVDPDGWSRYNMVTPEEFAELARYYIATYPEALAELHSVPFMVYPLPENMPEGREFKIQVPRKKENTNLLLKWGVDGVDGLKTGYIDQSGFNFTGTALREDSRLIAVIMGVHTDTYYQGLQTRAKETENLLEYGFENYRRIEMPRSDIEEQRVWFSSEKFASPEEAELPSVLLKDDEIDSVRIEITLEDDIIAPLKAGAVIGRAEYYLDDFHLAGTEIVLPEGLDKGPWYRRFQDWIIRSWADLKMRFAK